MPFDINSVPNFNVQEISVGPVEIILEDDIYVLYNDGIQWMSYSPSNNQEIKQMYSSYDLAYGDVLITGLGLGILALWLCNKPEVKSVTVIEKFPEIVEIFKKINKVPDNLKIINSDATTFTTNKKYDGIFLDHYELQTLDWRLRDMKKFCVRVKHDVFWAWSLENAYLSESHRIDNRTPSIDEQALLDNIDVTIGWKVFVKKFFPNEKSLLGIDPQKLKEYIYCYYDRTLAEESSIEFKTKHNSKGER